MQTFCFTVTCAFVHVCVYISFKIYLISDSPGESNIAENTHKFYLWQFYSSDEGMVRHKYGAVNTEVKQVWKFASII